MSARDELEQLRSDVIDLIDDTCGEEDGAVYISGWIDKASLGLVERKAPEPQLCSDCFNSNHSSHAGEGTAGCVKVTSGGYCLCKWRLPVADQFELHARRWEKETMHLSSPTQMAKHPSHQAIMELAKTNKREIITLMLHDLQDSGNHWYLALSELTGANPIKIKNAGRIVKMTEDWVRWGYENDYLSCESCNNTGYIETTLDFQQAPAGMVFIQRCDACEKYPNDLEAAKAYPGKVLGVACREKAKAQPGNNG